MIISQLRAKIHPEIIPDDYNVVQYLDAQNSPSNDQTEVGYTEPTSLPLKRTNLIKQAEAGPSELDGFQLNDFAETGPSEPTTSQYNHS